MVGQPRRELDAHRGAPSNGYNETLFKAQSFGVTAADPDPFNRRTPNFDAMHMAYAVAEEAVPFIRLGADCFITNNTPYAAEVQNDSGKNKIRPVNLPIEMAVQATEAPSLAGMGSISSARALELTSETLWR